MATNQPEKQLRDFTLSVRLRADMREKLGFVSDALGVSPATVASIAIGQYVASQHAALTASERQSKNLMDSLIPGMMDLFKTQLDEPESEPCSSFKDSSVQLPLLVAEPTKKPAKSSLSAQSFKSKRSTGADSSK